MIAESNKQIFIMRKQQIENERKIAELTKAKEAWRKRINNMQIKELIYNQRKVEKTSDIIARDIAIFSKAIIQDGLLTGIIDGNAVLFKKGCLQKLGTAHGNSEIPECRVYGLINRIKAIVKRN